MDSCSNYFWELVTTIQHVHPATNGNTGTQSLNSHTQWIFNVGSRKHTAYWTHIRSGFSVAGSLPPSGKIQVHALPKPIHRRKDNEFNTNRQTPHVDYAKAGELVTTYSANSPSNYMGAQAHNNELAHKVKFQRRSPQAHCILNSHLKWTFSSR